MARRAELESRSVSVLSWSDSGLAKEAIRRRLDHLIGVADRHDGAGQYANLDRLRCLVLVEIGRLVRDVEVDVDDLARDRRCRS
jgi:hypothetical protein